MSYDNDTDTQALGFEPVRLKPSEVKHALRLGYESKTPTVLKGPPGIAKSEMTVQLAHELFGPSSLSMPDYYRSVHLSHYDQVDLRGIPVPMVEKKLVEWLAPSFLPQDPDSCGIFVWDEFNSVLPSVQVVLQQALREHRIGDYWFPTGWYQLACGNEEADRAVAFESSTALNSRVTYLYVKADLADWTDWALANDIRVEIIAFLRFRPDLLHQFDPDHPDPSFPCPRTWEMASRELDAFDRVPNGNGSTIGNVERARLSGTVGVAAAAEVCGFLPLFGEIHDPRAVLAHPDRYEPPARPDVCQAMVAAMVAHTDRDNFQNGLRWVKQLQPEYQAYYVYDCIKRHPNLTATRAYIEWSAPHSTALINA